MGDPVIPDHPWGLPNTWHLVDPWKSGNSVEMGPGMEIDSRKTRMGISSLHIWDPWGVSGWLVEGEWLSFAVMQAGRMLTYTSCPCLSHHLTLRGWYGIIADILSHSQFTNSQASQSKSTFVLLKVPMVIQECCKILMAGQSSLLRWIQTFCASQASSFQGTLLILDGKHLTSAPWKAYHFSPGQFGCVASSWHPEIVVRFVCKMELRFKENGIFMPSPRAEVPTVTGQYSMNIDIDIYIYIPTQIPARFKTPNLCP